jgi:hypothetical protein
VKSSENFDDLDSNIFIICASSFFDLLLAGFFLDAAAAGEAADF